MPNTFDHTSHGDATLSLTTTTPDGGSLYQSWTICACGVDGLRDRLGPPQNESYATADTARMIAEATANTPGNIHLSG